MLSNADDAWFREMPCSGWIAFTDFGCTVWNTIASASCLSAQCCSLTIPTMLLVEGEGQRAPNPPSGKSSGLRPASGPSRNVLSMSEGSPGMLVWPLWLAGLGGCSPRQAAVTDSREHCSSQRMTNSCCRTPCFVVYPKCVFFFFFSTTCIICVGLHFPLTHLMGNLSCTFVELQMV